MLLLIGLAGVACPSDPKPRDSDWSGLGDTLPGSQAESEGGLVP